jgi:hypothetical protein
MGILPPGQVVSMEFELINESDEDYHIERVHPTCGCTTPQRDIDLVAANSSEIVEVRYRAAQRPGVKTSRILISPAGGGSTWSIVLRGDIREIITVEPSALRFSETSIGEAGEPQTLTFTLTNEAGEPVGLTEVLGLSEQFNVGFEPVTLASGETHTIAVTFTPPDDVLDYNSPLRIRTDHPEARELNIPIVATVSGSLVADPARLWFGFINQGESATQATSVRSAMGEEFEITDVRIAEERGFEIETSEGDDGAYTLTVTLNSAEREPGIINTRIHVQTTLESEPDFEIAVIGGVREPQ